MSDVLEEIRRAVEQAAERVGPAVVGLGRGWGRGSGVVIAAGTVLTNAHNLRTEELTVVIAGHEPQTATVLGLDADHDVAVLKVETGGVEPIAWDPDAAAELKHGHPVVALADPGGRGLRVTPGFVSAMGRDYRGPRGRRVAGMIEHTAPLPRGSSGGPLVDAHNRLLGLNTIRAEGGFILAIRADEQLSTRVELLQQGKSTARPRLGLALAPPRQARKLRAAVGLPERDGLLVRAVQDGSPAHRAGIQRGDLLSEVDERPITAVEDLYVALETSGRGATIQLKVVRGLEERETTVTLDQEESR